MFTSTQFRAAAFSTIVAGLLSLSGCATKPVPVAPAPAPVVEAPAPKAVIAIDQTPRGVQIPLPNTVLLERMM